MRIAICGCGWLGQPLAEHFLHAGLSVTGSKRQAEAASQLFAKGIEGIAFELGRSELTTELDSLFKADVLILNIPPGRKQFSLTKYVSHMQALLHHARQSGTSRCLFISTSAVYGEATRTVTETSLVDPQTESAKAHIVLESSVQEIFDSHGTILRLAGLIGAARHPVRFLAGKTGLSNPNRRVNLVHRDDVIASIEAIVRNDVFGDTLHLCASEHPTRSDYYRWAAQKLDLERPAFAKEPDGLPNGKVLDAQHTLDKLEMTLNFPSPFAML